MPIEKKIVVRAVPKSMLVDAVGESPRPEVIADLQAKLNAAPLADFTLRQLKVVDGFFWAFLEKTVP
jgi:hypothetical protein